MTYVHGVVLRVQWYNNILKLNFINYFKIGLTRYFSYDLPMCTCCGCVNDDDNFRVGAGNLLSTTLVLTRDNRTNNNKKTK